MDRKIKIGFVTSSLSDRDGWGRYSRSLVEAMAQQHPVKVLTASTEKSYSVVPSKTVLPPPHISLRSQLSVAWQTIRFLREVDIIHVLVEPYAPGVTLAAL